MLLTIVTDVFWVEALGERFNSAHRRSYLGDRRHVITVLLDKLASRVDN